MKIDRMKINRKRLNIELARKMWNMDTLAKKAGVSYEAMRRALSSNSAGATPMIAGKIAAALGVDVTEIIENGDS